MTNPLIQYVIDFHYNLYLFYTFEDPNKDTVDLILTSGMHLLLDGSLDVRTEAKTIFTPFISHPKFEENILRGFIERRCKDENNSETFSQIKKSLDTITKQKRIEKLVK